MTIQPVATIYRVATSSVHIFTLFHVRADRQQYQKVFDSLLSSLSAAAVRAIRLLERLKWDLGPSVAQLSVCMRRTGVFSCWTEYIYFFISRIGYKII